MTGLRICLVVAVVIGGASFLACSSSNETNPTATTPSGTTTQQGTTPSSTSSNAGAQLNDLVNKVATKTIKASYSFSGAGGTAETFTLYNKPPNRRVDLTTSGQTSTYMSVGGKDYICTAADQSCTASPVPFTSALAFLGFFTNPQTLSAIVGSGLNHSTKTVAGGDADCYSASAQGQTGEVCFNHDGILVSLSGGGVTMEATSVSGTVADSDLTLPYPVR